jgi:putative membrane protein
MSIIIHWLISAIAIIIAAYILPGVTISGFGAALVAALVLGLINALLRPALLLLALPLNILTLGLFTLVINAALVMLASSVVSGFQVDGFWWALLFSVVLAIVNAVFRPIEE